MNVILKEDIPPLGKRGDVVKVADGYARNYLFPRNKAQAATESALKSAAREKEVQERRAKKQREDAVKVKERIEALTVTLPRKVGDQDKLFGAVTSDDISAALGAQGFTVDKKDIKLDEPLRSLGQFTVPVRLFPDVDATVTIQITKED